MDEKKLVNEYLSSKILSTIKDKIRPDVKLVFLKLFLVHLVVALMTLSVCPQFGISLLKTNIDFSHYFLLFGERGCELICGFIFTSTSIAVSFLFLTRDEVRFLKFNKIYLASIFILVSIGLLLMFNSQLFVELSILWLFGTFAGVVGTLEIGAFILRYVH
jgi:hypothetical protein